MKKVFYRTVSLMTALALVFVMCFAFTGCDSADSNVNSNGSNNGSNSSEGGNDSPATYPTQIYDKNGNPVQMPDDNDEEGWFSVELLNQYSAPGFTLPDGTVVTNKPQRDTLYLKGDENAFKTSVLYAFDSIKGPNDSVYVPVYTIGENEVAEISALKEIRIYRADNLYPQGDETSVTFIYKSAHKLYQCSISLENTPDDGEQVCISFSEKTDEYKALI